MNTFLAGRPRSTAARWRWPSAEACQHHDAELSGNATFSVGPNSQTIVALRWPTASHRRRDRPRQPDGERDRIDAYRRGQPQPGGNSGDVQPRRIQLQRCELHLRRRQPSTSACSRGSGTSSNARGPSGWPQPAMHHGQPLRRCQQRQRSRGQHQRFDRARLPGPDGQRHRCNPGPSGLQQPAGGRGVRASTLEFAPGDVNPMLAIYGTGGTGNRARNHDWLHRPLLLHRVRNRHDRSRDRRRGKQRAGWIRRPVGPWQSQLQQQRTPGLRHVQHGRRDPGRQRDHRRRVDCRRCRPERQPRKSRSTAAPCWRTRSR